MIAQLDRSRNCVRLRRSPCSRELKLAGHVLYIETYLRKSMMDDSKMRVIDRHYILILDYILTDLDSLYMR